MRLFKRKKKREDENPEMRKQRIKKWLILIGVYFVVGILLYIILPYMRCSCVDEKDTPITENEIISIGEVTRIDSLQVLTASSYKVLINETEYVITLEGVDITDGYTVGDTQVDINLFNSQFNQYLTEGNVYFEKSQFLSNNQYTGYIWFTDTSTITSSELSSQMYNAMLIYGNCANASDIDHKYKKYFISIEENRPKMNSIVTWIMKKLNWFNLDSILEQEIINSNN